MDVNVNVNYKQSEINGLYQDVESLKKERARLKDSIDKKTETIISHILNNGNVLAYKDDKPHVLTVKYGRTIKFDKSALASELNVTVSELNYIGLAELVEEKRITSGELKKYEYEEDTQKLKARKAKKSDIDLLGARAI
ncbi:hypothetical protein [Terrihalobacillus insolitus]|uniref:hypothetical protein n=1 Tax=Terrihalobacillus insolitus TaxID=2950438 RepID=UPI002340DBD0|nr:hypothetical protein [Terrihalobacillus insolitus]MDC3412558.1 hypothetical protein [Terrihalobacillus insolitus]